MQRHEGNKETSNQQNGATKKGKPDETITKEKCKMIFMFIMAVIGCGDLVFLGVLSQTVFAKINPSFYWWGIAAYTAAGIFAIRGVYEIVTYCHKRRNKSKKAAAPAAHPRGKRKSNNKKRSKK